MITQDELKQVYSYNPETGEFTRLRRTKNRLAGEIVGCIDKSTGYVRLGIGNKVYHAHRLAWLYVKGYLPDKVDHIDGKRSNNIFSNLREVDSLGNSRNVGRRSDNTTGVTGVTFQRGKYETSIWVEGKRIFLGYFTELADAAKARKIAERKYGFHENHGRAV